MHDRLSYSNFVSTCSACTAQLHHRVKSDYMRKQSFLAHSMRSVLVDWLIEVAIEYKLERETLCLAIGYVDRFLMKMSVARDKLQLLGAAAMFVAT